MQVKHKGLLNTTIVLSTIILFMTNNVRIINFLSMMIFSYTLAFWFDWLKEEKRKLTYILTSLFAPLSALVVGLVIDDLNYQNDMYNSIRITILFFASYFLFYDILKKTKYIK